MKTGCIRYGYDAALMILSHLTINSMKQSVLFVTTKQSTFNFFPAPQKGAGKNFFFARFAREHQPPISIFVILTLVKVNGNVTIRYSAYDFLVPTDVL